MLTSADLAEVRGVKTPGAGVPGGWNPPDEGAGNRIQVFYKSGLSSPASCYPDVTRILITEEKQSQEVQETAGGQRGKKRRMEKLGEMFEQNQLTYKQ